MTDRFKLFTEHCTNLEVLNISFDMQDPEVWDNLSTLVRRNPRIKSIDILDVSFKPPPKAFLEALSACTGLRKLKARMDEPDGIEMELILDIAIHLEHLRIYGSNIFLPKSLDKWSCFPVMKQLKLNADTDFPIPLEIFRKCPKLRTLTWRSSEDMSDSVFDLCELLRIHCPLIETLTLFSESLTDMDLSLVLDSCREVTSLSIYYPMFGEQAFQSLSRLFPNIRQLNFKGCRGLTSAMAQQIMTSCPNLIQFSGASLKARDLLGLVKDEVTEEEKMVTQDWIWLDSLSSLKQLMVLDLSGGLQQEMEEQDVRWMLEAWPKVSRVSGILHPNKERLEKLCQILQERKVDSYSYSISDNSTDVTSGEDTEQEEEEEEDENEDEDEEEEPTMG
ncbi:hypothetical protein BGZ65_010462 [Modicella reniformis]|uniref:Uncharacterized protein n=1 Tax=Modicella reniformis TaxID=1440133 RepID=A0A9P6MAP3_9FUNG|nr:hypothetical protein BGZ65_010462 [Modicella reniformis]